MLSILRNDWNRMMQQKIYMLVAIGLTLCSVVIAVVLTNKLESKINIAVVGPKVSMVQTAGLDITWLNEMPARSSLVKNRYDAVIQKDAAGKYQISTIKSEKIRQRLQLILDGKVQEGAGLIQGRKIGTNIMGYMLMFLLMQGTLYARLFAEDKEKHMMERIAVSPIAFYKYLLGHIVFVWGLIALPSFLVILGADMLGIAVGFTLLQYAFLIGVLSFLSTCFAICLNSFFCNADTANMAANSIIILSSVLAGAFYDMGDGNTWFGHLLYFLPQKDFVYFTEHLENSMINSRAVISILYVIMCSALFIIVGVTKTKKDYIYHRS